MVIGERHRGIEELGVGIPVGPTALGDGDSAELIAGRAVAMHMTLGDEGILSIDAEKAVVSIQALGESVGARGTFALALARRGRTQWSVGEYACDAVGHPGGNGLGGMHDHRGRRRAAEIHGRGQAQIAQPHRLLQRVRRHRIVEPGDTGIDQQAVEIGAIEAGVFQREVNGLGSETHRARMIEVLAHPGLSEPGDSAFCP